MQLCQVRQLFEERDDFFFRGPGSHRGLLISLVRSSDSRSRPLLQLLNELGEPVGIVELEAPHGLLEPSSVLRRHCFELGGTGPILVFHGPFVKSVPVYHFWL